MRGEKKTSTDDETFHRYAETVMSGESSEQMSEFTRENPPLHLMQTACPVPISENMEIQVTPVMDFSTNTSPIQSIVNQNSVPSLSHQSQNLYPPIDSLQANSYMINMNDERTVTSNSQSNIIHDVPSSVQGVSQSINNEDHNAINSQRWSASQIFEGFTHFQLLPMFICFCIIFSRIRIHKEIDSFCLILLIIVYIISNGILTGEIIKQKHRHKILLFFNSICIVSTLVSITLMLKRSPILVFERAYVPENFFWSIVVTDYVLKLITIFLKTFVALLPSNILHFNKRGKWYQLIEGFSQISRAIFSMFPWLWIFIGYHWKDLLPLFLIAIYTLLKTVEMGYKLLFFLSGFFELWQTLNLGLRITDEELSAIDNQCIICYENLSSPIKLRCLHIFCETCLFTWLEKEHTCPLCRTVIVKAFNTNMDTEKYTDGHTSKGIQLI